MKQLYIATLLCSNSLLPTITLPKMKSLNSWGNRHSVPGARIRAGKPQYLNAQWEFFKTYRLFFICFHLFKSYAVLTSQLLQWTQCQARVCTNIQKKVIYSNLQSPFCKAFVLLSLYCGRFQRCINTTMLPRLEEYTEHKYINTSVLNWCYRQQK